MICLNRWLWLALLALLPLAYNPWSRWHYEPDKVALLLVFTGVLMGGALSSGDLRRLKPAGVERWIVLFLVVRWLSLAGSIAPEWSLWGDPRWRNGVWLTLAGAGLFFLARRQLGAEVDRERIVNALLLGSGLVAAYGIFEYATQGVVRASSTQSHATLLAGYLVMVLPFTVMRLITHPRRIWFAGLFVVQGMCLLFTYTRAGWLAAMIGLGVWVIAWLWLTGRRRIAGLLVGLMAAGFATLFVLSMLPPLPGSAPHWLQTLTSLFRWKGATARIRLLGWEASLDAIRTRPWLGYGPATFRSVFDWHMPPELAPFGGAPALGARMHNVYLEIALESGLIGLGVYLVMLGVMLGPLMRAVIQAEPGQTDSASNRLFQISVLASLAAMLVNNLFSFETASTGLLFWVLAGAAHAQPAPMPVHRYAPQRWGWGIAVAGIILAGLIVGPDMIMYRAERRAAEGQWDAALMDAERATRLTPTPGLYKVIWAYMAADQAHTTGSAAAWAAGAEVLDQLAVRRSSVAEYHERRGLYYRRWYATSKHSDLAQSALEAYTRALELSPRDPDLWLDRGLVRLEIDDPAGALADFEQAHQLLGDYARYYGAMSLYALVQNDPAAAADWNARAVAAQQAWDDWVWRR